MQPLIRTLVRPLFAFNFTWALILVCYYGRLLLFFDSGPTLLQIYGLSLVGFLIGIAGVMLASGPVQREVPDSAAAGRRPRLLLLDLVQTIAPLVLPFAWLVSLVILVHNYLSDGLPPIFTLGGFASEDYISYGSFNALWQATAMVTFVLSVLERGPKRWLMMAVPAGLFVVYLTRGWLISTIAVWILFHLVLPHVAAGRPRRQTSEQNLRDAARLAVYLTVMMAAMWGLGELRSGGHQMTNVLQVNSRYHFLGPAPLWVLAYVSGPVDNVVYWLDQPEAPYRGVMTLRCLVPGFLGEAIVDFDRRDLSRLVRNPHNTATSYLGPAVLDFRWYGVLLTNVAYGAIAWYTYQRRRDSKVDAGTYAFVLVALYLICFYPFLMNFPFLLAILLFRNAAPKSERATLPRARTSPAYS